MGLREELIQSKRARGQISYVIKMVKTENRLERYLESADSCLNHSATTRSNLTNSTYNILRTNTEKNLQPTVFPADTLCSCKTEEIGSF